MTHERTRLARAGWTTTNLFITAAAAVVLAACQAAGAGGSPSAPTGTPVPTPIAEWATFESDRYGYAIDHPADWEPREKVGSAVPSILRPYNPGADFITTPYHHKATTRHGVQVAAAPVERGTDLMDFTNDVHMSCGSPWAEEEITLGGEAAISRTFSCNGNRPVYVQITAIHHDMGYVVWLMTSERPHADDRDEYETIIDSFKFTDSTAASGG
jgi:hypothetical protein